MNRIRKIQLSLFVAMLILIAIVVGNFNHGHRQETMKASETDAAPLPSESGETRMESGVHVLYRNGKPYATLHFKEAVKTGDVVRLANPVLELTGVAGKLTAEFADLQGETVLLKGDITFYSPQDKLSVSLAPPATFKDGIISGAGVIQATLNTGVFEGNGYVVKISDGELLAKKRAQFSNTGDGILLQGEIGVMNLKRKSFTFVKTVRVRSLGNTEFESTTDAAILDTATGRLLMAGGGEIKISPLTVVRFTEATLWRKSGMWNGRFPAPVYLRGKGRTAYLPGGSIKDSKLIFPWSIVQTNDVFVSTGEGSYSLQNSRLHAIAPYGRGLNTNFTGTDIFSTGLSSDQGATITFPEIKRAGLGWATGNRGKLKANGNFEMEGNVSGEVQNRQFLTDSAYIAGDFIRLRNAISWDENTQSFSSGGVVKIENNQYTASNQYQMTRYRGKGKAPLTISSENARGIEGGPVHLSGDVRTTMEKIVVNAPQSYVYEWGSVFFDADFSGLQVQKGHADLLIVVSKQHVVIMLGNADVTDKDGNHITGHKLTLSTITGRISVYSGKKKVRMRLAL